MRNDNVINMNGKNALFEYIKKNPFPFIVIGFILIILFNSLIVVGAGQRVVVFNSLTGVEKRTLGEGVHLLIPFIQHPVNYDVRTNTYTMSATSSEGEQRGDDGIDCLTKDGQKIKLDLSIVYNIIPSKAWIVHQNIGPDYVNKIIRPISRSVARNAVANYTVGEIYSVARIKIQKELEEKIRSNFDKYDIQVSEALIRTITFSEEFTKAIEQKQVALQEAERMKYVLEKEVREKQRKIIEADGDAEAIRRKGFALKSNPSLIQYEYVNKISPSIKTIITDQKSIMNLPKEFFN